MAQSNNKTGLKVFLSIMTLVLVLTAIIVLLSGSQEDKLNTAMWGITIFSMVVVAFQIWLKEVVIYKGWSSFPLFFRFTFWFIFIGNTINFMSQFMDAFIFNR